MAVVVTVCGRQTTQIQIKIQIHVTLLGIEENAPYLVDDYRYTLMMKCVLSRFFLRQTILNVVNISTASRFSFRSAYHRSYRTYSAYELYLIVTVDR